MLTLVSNKILKTFTLKNGFANNAIIILELNLNEKNAQIIENA